MSGLGLGGDAWAKDHDKILDHARGLHYDHYLERTGGLLPSADAPKNEWISAMDKFNAWKAREVAKEASGQAWWQTYPASQTPPSSGNTPPPSGGGGGGGGGNTDPPTGPWPEDNIYFPMLVPDYDAPKALDWGRYMPRGYMPGSPNPSPNLTGGPIHGGLLYQPWTSNYQHHFVPDSLWDYKPVEFGVPPVSFIPPPFGPINVVPPEELFTEEEEEEDEYVDPPGGDSPDNPGADPGQPPGLGIGDHPDLDS